MSGEKPCQQVGETGSKIEIMEDHDLDVLNEKLFFLRRGANIIGWTVYPSDCSKEPTRGFLFHPDAALLFEYPGFAYKDGTLIITLDGSHTFDLKPAWYVHSEDSLTSPLDAPVRVQRVTMPLDEQANVTLSFVQMAVK